MHINIVAAGDVVHLGKFISGSSIACLLITLFVLSGRALFYPVNLFQQPKIDYFGYYFIMGLCPFLILIKLFSLKSGFSFSLLLAIGISFCISIIPYYKKTGIRWRDFIKTIFHTGCWVFVIGYLALFAMHVIARYRVAFMYAELAQYIVDTNSLPLLNRHHGQSILGAIILSIFKKPDLALARMSVNIWLPLSQAFLLLIIYSLTENLNITKANRIIVCIIAFAGNCALSFLPYIPSDHDFPLIFNIYADSIISLGVSIIVASISILLMKDKDIKFKQFIYFAALLYLLLTSLNLNSELDMLVLIASLAPIFIITASTKKMTSFPHLLILLLVVSLAVLSCNFMGGILIHKKHAFVPEQKYTYLFDDANANSAVTNILPTKSAWWYIPYVTPGFYKNFGNYESVFDKVSILDNSYNALVMSAKSEGENHIVNSSLIRAIYLLEMRVSTIFKVLFWPLMACCGCIWLLFRLKHDEKFSLESCVNEDVSLSFLISKEGISFTIITFLAGLSVILLNSHPGNAIYWKWALTRLNEIGIFLMMIYVGIFSVLILESIKRSRLVAILKVALLILLLSGVIMRLIVYPSFGG